MMNEKAGIIPYIVDPKDGQLKFLFMVSSDPTFGGSRPMISKGDVEAGESLIDAAIREGKEELGLKSENFVGEPFQIAAETCNFKFGSYDLTIFGVEVKDKKDFDKPHYETKFTLWWTVESFMVKGRTDHRKIVQKLSDYLAIQRGN